MSIGLIAGSGTLPDTFRKEAVKKGKEVFTVGIEGITEIETEEKIPVGNVSKIIEVLRKRNVREVVMLGKFEHKLIYMELLNVDKKLASILKGSKTKKPADIINGFISYMESEGFRFIDPKPFLSSIISDKGLMNRVSPSEDALKDAEFGFPIAKKVADMDVGQTIVVKEKAVVAVEAMEGTQKTIERAGSIAGKGCRVIKVGRSNQDFRVDVPTVGIETIEIMKSIGADSLFIEAESVYMVDKEDMLRLADEYNISVYGIDDKIC